MIRSRRPRFVTVFVFLFGLVQGADTHAAPRGSPKWLCAQLETDAGARQQCLDLINAGVSQKRLRYDRAAAGACGDAYQATQSAKSATSNSKTTEPSIVSSSGARLDAARQACRKAIQGLQKANAPCDAALDCQEGLTCIQPAGRPPGRCRPPLAKGEACDDSVLSQSVLHTLIGALQPICQKGLRCRPEKGALKCGR